MGGVGRRAALALAMVLAVAAPLPFGAVGATARAALALTLAIGLSLLALDRAALARPPLRFAALAVATVALTSVFVVPLPPGLVATLSPRLAREARLSLAFPGEDEALAGAERALAGVAGGARWEGVWRPLAVDTDASLEGATRLLLALGAFLLGLLAAGDQPQDRRRLAAALGVSAFLQAGYGLAEALSGSNSVLGWFNPYFRGLATGTFVSPNHFAALVSLGLFALIGLAASDDRRRVDSATPGRDDPSAHSARLTLIATAIGVATIGLLWSSSRAALVAAAAGLVLFGAALASSGTGGRRRMLVLCGGALIAVGLVLGALLLRPVQPLIADVEKTGTDYAARLQLWRLAVRVAGAFPVAGVGPGGYEVAHRLLRPLELPQVSTHAHSDYLEVWAETGPVGLLLLLAWAAATAGGSVALLRWGPDRALTMALGAGLLALALHETVDFALQLPGVAVPAALLAGALLAPLPWQPGPARRAASPIRIWAAVLWLIATALLLAAGATYGAQRQLPPGPAGSDARLATPNQVRRWARAEIGAVVGPLRPGQVLTSAQRDRLGLAFLAAQRAARRAPLRSEGQLTLWVAAQAIGAAAERSSTGFDALSRHYLRRAVALDPANQPLHLQVVRSWSAYGDPREARRAVRSLLEFAPEQASQAYATLGGATLDLAELMEATPNEPRAVRRLAHYLQSERSDFAGAQIVLERALGRWPENPALRTALADVLVSRGRPAEGLASLDAAPQALDLPTRRWGLLVRAQALIALQRFDRFDRTLNELAALGEDRGSLALVRARGLAAAGERERAIDVLTAALTAPGPPLPERQRLDLLLALGREQVHAGRTRGALRTLRQAERIDPQHPEVRAFFSRLDPATESR